MKFTGKKRNEMPAELKDPGPTDTQQAPPALPPIPPLRTFLVKRLNTEERVAEFEGDDVVLATYVQQIDAHYYEFGDDGAVAFIVVFDSAIHHGRASAPSVVIAGGQWLDIKEVNAAFPTLATQGH